MVSHGKISHEQIGFSSDFGFEILKIFHFEIANYDGNFPPKEDPSPMIQSYASFFSEYRK